MDVWMLYFIVTIWRGATLNISFKMKEFGVF